MEKSRMEKTAENRISFKFLVENKTDNPGIMAEHGLSIYIEACGRRILFDAGATDLVISNAKRLGVDLSAVDAAVVSHGHYDHTGGFPAFCRINETAPIYIHKNAFRESYGLKDGRLSGSNDGIRWSSRQRAHMEGRLVFTEGAAMIDEDIYVSGTIPYEEGFEPTEKFYYKDEQGCIREDDMSHEQCLVIRQREGLYVFSGCSHRGVISALNAAKAIFPKEKVAVLVAGMHLYSASDEDRKRVVEQIAGEHPDCVMPVHCTGIKAICDLKARLGDACIVATAGDGYDGR